MCHKNEKQSTKSVREKTCERGDQHQITATRSAGTGIAAVTTTLEIVAQNVLAHHAPTHVWPPEKQCWLGVNQFTRNRPPQCRQRTVSASG